MAVRVHVLERHPVRVVVVLDDLDPVRSYSLEHGGVLPEAEISRIVLADGELTEFAFVCADEVAARVTPLLARRVASCLEAPAAGTVATLENGSPAV
jgi:hypothetical protein